MKKNTSNYTLDHQPDMAWCPGCGNYQILAILKMVLTELGIDSKKTAIVSGIGQAAKTPQYLNTNYFNGLHGRTQPVASGIKAANPELTVIAESGDGDTYSEGGNHFIHAIRRNSNITNIVHNNMIYGLTKGQASPTSAQGFTTKLQYYGVHPEPFNPIAVAVSLKASFVARINSADIPESKEILKQAIQHKGYALVDVFQSCPVFNKVNTREWFQEHTYYLDEIYDPTDRQAAFAKSIEEDRFPLGIIYKNTDKETFEDSLPAYKQDKRPLYERMHSEEEVRELVEKFKV